jgi:hypothetical protein
MLVGLQGSGKTTSAGKLAYLHKNKLNKKVLLAGLDVYRPAAIDQLGQIAKQIDVDFFEMGTECEPGRSRQESRRKSNGEKATTFLILDTAGRLQIDEKLMGELKDIRKRSPSRRDLASRRCDGGPRRGQRRECLQHRCPSHRRHHVQTRWRCQRRRGLIHQISDRACRSSSPASARKSPISISSIRTGWPIESSGWAMSSPWSRKPKR